MCGIYSANVFALQWHHATYRWFKGVLGQYVKLVESPKESGRAEATGHVLQRRHAEVPGEIFLFEHDALVSISVKSELSDVCVVVCDIWDLGSQVSTQGIQSTPLNLAVSWRGDASCTDLRIDYKYSTEAMPIPTPLTNIHFMAAVDGGVNKLQAMLPPATWWGSVEISLQINSSVVLYSDVCPFVAFLRNPEMQKITWKIPELSQRSENGGTYPLDINWRKGSPLTALQECLADVGNCTMCGSLGSMP